MAKEKVVFPIYVTVLSFFFFLEGGGGEEEGR